MKTAFQEGIDYYKTLVGMPYSDEYPTPTNETIDIATKAIKLFEPYNIHQPKPMITTDGVIGAYWWINKDYVSIDFHTDETFTWASSQNDVFSGGEWKLNDPIPQKILDIITIK